GSDISTGINSRPRVDGNGGNDGNGGTYTYTWIMDGQRFTIKCKFKKISSGIYSDIAYLLYQSPDAVDAKRVEDRNSFYALTYNIYGVFTQGAEDIKKRFRAIASSQILNGHDILIFNEAFNDGARSMLRSAIKNEYPYMTRIIKAPLYRHIINGGIFIASRWPIEIFDQYIYQHSGFPDSFAAKGVQYVKINKKGKYYHIFATHINWDGHPEIRMQQLEEMRVFVDSKNIPSEEAVIIGGDFNTDPHFHPTDYERMLVLLNCDNPQRNPDSFSCDPCRNARLTPGDTNDRSLFDHILVQRGHLRPLSAQNNVVILKSAEDEMFGTLELSDHFPVEGIFRFQNVEEGDNFSVDAAGDFSTEEEANFFQERRDAGI
ncbi:MAG: sphingomyelin phosphodiesterase, partial [Oligoflexia bacterium]|nr:sphingomyelin phosphodiesterase [Oligoflexia bacterium]